MIKQRAQARLRSRRKELYVLLHAQRRDQTRIHELEVELEREKRARMDVERECQAPFVVPALLDAFLALSGAADEIMAAP